MSTDHVSRGVPAQHLLENQDPDVLYNVDEVTGAVSAIVGAPAASASPKGKKSAATTKAAEPAPSLEEEDVDAAGAGE